MLFSRLAALAFGADRAEPRFKGYYIFPRKPAAPMENSMNSESIQQAASYVQSLKLPPKPRVARRENRGGAPVSRSVVERQAAVVGTDIVSFVAGTDPKLRAAIINCSLLAQLGAKRKVPALEGVQSWYNAYFEILQQLGWAIQSRGFSEHHEGGDEFESHRAILSIATTLLGSATPAFAIVQSTLESMKDLADGSWVTIFQRESQTARAAHFQVTVAEPAAHGGVTTSLMAFDFSATKNVTQFLFFKFRSVDVKLLYSSGRVVIDRDLLVGLAPAIATRVGDYVQSYVANIPI
jgi:hypothetical protein